MPPFQPEPRLDVRQAPYGVTLTVIRASTTYTTFITLAPGASTTDLGYLTTTTTPPSQTTATTTTATTTAPAASTSTTFVGAAPSHGPSNGVVVGAIMGSFVGFCVLLAFMWYCCYGGRNLCCVWYDDSDTDSYYSYDSGSSESRTRIRVQRRGGWMGAYGVRRPGRARVRVRRESVTTTTRSGSRSRVMMERRKSNRVPLFGFMYFGLNGAPRSEVVSAPGRRSRVRRESVIGRGFTVDD